MSNVWSVLLMAVMRNVDFLLYSAVTEAMCRIQGFLKAHACDCEVKGMVISSLDSQLFQEIRLLNHTNGLLRKQGISLQHQHLTPLLEQILI